MKEILFLKNNAERWQGYEQSLRLKGGKDPDELSSMFIRITDDLSYSRTSYPDSRTTEYLNGLTALIHQRIYRNKKESKGRLLRFWKEDIPSATRSSHRHIFITFLMFVIAWFAGAVSATNDDTFVRVIFGDEYVNTTIENIRKGDPFGIYKSMSEGNMFAGITLNNVFVSFKVYALGIFLGIGTVVNIIFTGVMVGSFQAFFHKYGLLGSSFLNVYIHGALELSAIVLAGGAGLRLAAGLMFPGTFSRRISLEKGAKDSVKIIAGLVPVFIMAGFLESFVTRRSEMHYLLKLSIIVFSFAFIAWYFIYLPLKQKNRER